MIYHILFRAVNRYNFLAKTFLFLLHLEYTKSTKYLLLMEFLKIKNKINKYQHYQNQKALFLFNKKTLLLSKSNKSSD